MAVDLDKLNLYCSYFIPVVIAGALHLWRELRREQKTAAARKIDDNK